MTEFANRHQIEEYLAERAEGGVIVELGGGYGHGAVALVDGTRAGRNLPVYVIDPYETCQDELGGQYGPETETDLWANLEAHGYRDKVTLVRRSALDAATEWNKPIALLWFDVSVLLDQMRAMVNAWEPHVVEGGLLAVAGLDHAKLQRAQLIDELKRRGWTHELVEQNKVAVLRKTTQSRACFWICDNSDGGRYVREAARSADSARQYLALPCHLFLQGQIDQDVSIFDMVYSLPAPRGPFWYLDNCRYFNQAVVQLSDYRQLLYLDVDTHVCCPCLDIFQPLEKFDMLFGLSAQRDAIESALGTPASFTTRQIGVNPFNNSARVRDFLAYWLALYEEHWRIYDNNDEAPMRDALYSCPDIRVALLPPEYCLRFDFGAWVVGKVRILHGRRGGVSIDRAPLSHVATEINSTTKMRIWNHGLLGS